MGIISLEKADHLYWIGRYTERVFTTLVTFFDYYDQMIDTDFNAYQEYCNMIAIPDIYGDRATFSKRYLFDPYDPNSVYSNLKRAYDNAIVIRDEITSYTLAYIQLALDHLQAASGSMAPHYDLQQVIDDLHAFWGCADDRVDDEEARNIMKCGKYLERLDLYIRLGYPDRDIERACRKFINRLDKVHLKYHENCRKTLREIIGSGCIKQHKDEVLAAVWNFF